ncbi:MAG: S8 family serine peptidase [Campylobacterota bacterium]|nr:S8 family serine peptidase [Campylobacterota bacterium]
MYKIALLLAFILLSGCSKDSTEKATPLIINEPYYYQQWSINSDDLFYSQNAIDADAHINAGDILNTYSGSSIKVAVIDDGVDVNHEDLAGAISATYNVLTKSTDVSHTYQDDIHGTAVTGIIAARLNAKGIVGLARRVQIISIKIEDSVTDGDLFDAFSKAEEFGADVISCSWGTYDVSPVVEDKIIELSNNGRGGKGTIIVFASGNDNQDMENDESAIPEVVAVGATNKDNLRAGYSNFGANLDIMAPGGEYLGITSLDPSGNEGLSSIDENYLLYDDSYAFGGTSASAPMISGVVALMLEKNPTLTRVEVDRILKEGSDKIGTVSYENGRNDYYGYGKINLVKIMNLI